jgi:vacuolar iron transporter family protein
MSKNTLIPREHPPEVQSSNSQLNWLRAAVLGANDGILSVSGLVVGVASATTDRHILLATGIAGLIAGALSMAVGEYVSVSSHRDTEKALLARERWELKHFPEAELQELIGIYESKGMSRKTAELVATELTEKDAFAAHVDAELGIDPDDLTNPWHAAYASALSFFAGAIIPVVAIVAPPVSLRIPVTFASVIFALVLTGVLSARASKAHIGWATFRVVIGGVLAMAATYGVGRLFGVSTV